jgi:hypothetical protein
MIREQGILALVIGGAVFFTIWSIMAILFRMLSDVGVGT